jgi:hypothetical protein
MVLKIIKTDRGFRNVLSVIQVVRAKLLMVCNNTKHLVGAYTMGVD